MKKPLRILAIAQIEAQYLLRYPKLLIAMLVMTLVPAGYALIYLFSVWDPISNTAALPVAIVNHDRGMNFHDQVFNVGLEVVAALQLDGRFGYKVFREEEDARREVRQGRMAFALIIPREFSANAVPGTAAGAAKPVIFTSEGNNYQSASMARHFAELLVTQINESLNERRWALVLRTAVGSQRSVEQLRVGVRQLSQGALQLQQGAEQSAEGAKKLAAGNQRLKLGVAELSDGFKQLSAGMKTLDARRPSNHELNRLKNGSEELAAGHGELDNGLGQLYTGSVQLRSGAEHFRDLAQSSSFLPGSALDSAEQFVDGLSRLETGLATAQSSEKKLAEGAEALRTGVDSLTSGLRTAFSSIHSAVQKLPDDNQVDELEQGGSELAQGAHKLADANIKVADGAKLLSGGISQLAAALPGELATPEGSAQGLAESVEPQFEIDAPVANSGSGFAPSVLAGAMWLGAGVAAFLLHARAMPRQARIFSRPVQLLGKITIPSGVVLAQVIFVFVTSVYVLKIPLVDPPAFALCLTASGLTFLLITFALTLALGDAGKGLAMVLLAIQLSSSGGMLPVELSGQLFMDISPWLPLTWVVKALKASMFGAYEGDWQNPMLFVCIFACVAFFMACVTARWRFVSPKKIRPAIDV